MNHTGTRNDRSENGQRFIDGHFWLLNGSFDWRPKAIAEAKRRRVEGIKCRVIKLGFWDYWIYDRLDCIHGARFKK